MIESIIRARRAALAAQMAQAQQQYDQLEATLSTLDRQLCMMAGGLQAYDALLAERAARAIAANGDWIGIVGDQSPP